MSKPKLFIGSSSEKLSLARKAAKILSTDFEAIIWDEKDANIAVFGLNDNFFYSLLTASLKFDYGLLIGSADDKRRVRKKEVLVPRDNVLFELGLFMGRLGKNKCAFLVDKNLSVLSDLAGISLSSFDGKKPGSFEEGVKRVKNFFLKNKQPEINFFPSTTLASVYFENFLHPVCSHIIKNKGFDADKKHYGNCLVHVIIPDVIDDNVNLQFDQIKTRFKTKSISFDYEGRPRSVTVDIRKNTKRLEIVDFPTVIAGINYAIGQLLPEDFKNKSKHFKAIRIRELQRFCNTLKDRWVAAGYKNLVCFKKEKSGGKATGRKSTR